MTDLPAVSAVQMPVQRPCPSCQREFGLGVSCQFCDQVQGLPTGIQLSSVGRRFGGYLLEGLLVVVTVGLGWLIWAAIVFGRGQTPAKQILGMRVIDLRRARKATWGKMFLREVVAKLVIGVLSFVTFGIINFWLTWDDDNQELWDKVVGTVVVNDPRGALAERPSPSPAAPGGRE